MQEFQIRLRCVKDVQDFVSIATTCPYTITLRDAHNKVNGKSFMELFCLDFSNPIRVLAQCGEEEVQRFRLGIDPFLVK